MQQQAKHRFLREYRVNFCFDLSCLTISKLWLLFFFTIAEHWDDFFLKLSYANFKAGTLKIHCLSYTVLLQLIHVAGVLTTLNSFASMDFLAALLLPFPRSSLGVINSPDWPAALEWSLPVKTGFSCSMFYVFSHSLIQTKISPLDCLA